MEGDPAGGDRLSELFERALGLGPRERAAFLEAACGGDERRHGVSLPATDRASRSPVIGSYLVMDPPMSTVGDLRLWIP